MVKARPCSSPHGHSPLQRPARLAQGCFPCPRGGATATGMPQGRLRRRLVPPLRSPISPLSAIQAASSAPSCRHPSSTRRSQLSSACTALHHGQAAALARRALSSCPPQGAQGRSERLSIPSGRSLTPARPATASGSRARRLRSCRLHRLRPSRHLPAPRRHQGTGGHPADDVRRAHVRPQAHRRQRSRDHAQAHQGALRGPEALHARLLRLGCCGPARGAEFARGLLRAARGGRSRASERFYRKASGRGGRRGNGVEHGVSMRACQRVIGRGWYLVVQGGREGSLRFCLISAPPAVISPASTPILAPRKALSVNTLL